MVGNIGNRCKFHHGTGTFNGVHDTEDFIYIVCGEIPNLFIGNEHFI